MSLTQRIGRCARILGSVYKGSCQMKSHLKTLTQTMNKGEEMMKSKPNVMRLMILLSALVAASCSAEKKDDIAPAAPTAVPTVNAPQDENMRCCDFPNVREEHLFIKTDAVADLEKYCKSTGATWSIGKCSRSGVTVGCKLTEDPKGFTTTLWKTTSSSCIDGQTKVNP